VAVGLGGSAGFSATTVGVASCKTSVGVAGFPRIPGGSSVQDASSNAASAAARAPREEGNGVFRRNGTCIVTPLLVLLRAPRSPARQELFGRHRGCAGLRRRRPGLAGGRHRAGAAAEERARTTRHGAGGHVRGLRRRLGGGRRAG